MRQGENRQAQIASMGANVVWFLGPLQRGGARSGWGWGGTLTIEDADSTKRAIPGVTVLSRKFDARPGRCRQHKLDTPPSG